MKIKFFLMFFAGFILYLLLTASVLLFYKDDPAQMTWQDRENFNAKLISGYNLADDPTRHYGSGGIKRQSVSAVLLSYTPQVTRWHYHRR